MKLSISDLPEVDCPRCGVKGLIIEHRLEAQPIGTWSLAGYQPKVSARRHPWLRCVNCGAEARGKPDIEEKETD